MTERIKNEQAYYDRTVQDWHFRVFPKEHAAIDLDLMGACRLCGQPVYLIEATTNPNKQIRYLRALAARAQVPAFIVWHDYTTVMRSRMIWPRTANYEGQVLTQLALMVQRNNHTRDTHPDYWKYLTERKNK